MHCIVTAGPTYEPLDKVRRLTNFSTGQLGSELTQFLAARGHQVKLLLGEHATYRLPFGNTETFGTTGDLQAKLRDAAGGPVDAVFHAAAVSDFQFGKIWSRGENGELSEMGSGKITTREGNLLAELVPTVKIISHLRELFPVARLVGWKFEVDGERSDVIQRARAQIQECRTDACVANGPAYGRGYGLVQGDQETIDLADKTSLFEALSRLIQS